MTKENRKELGKLWKLGTDERLHYLGSKYEEFYLEFKKEIDAELKIGGA